VGQFHAPVEGCNGNLLQKKSHGHVFRLNRLEGSSARTLLPFSIHIDVVGNGSEDVEKQKGHEPVQLLVSRQAVVSTQIPGHPEPKRDQRQNDHQWNGKVRIHASSFNAKRS
jgi:hypothetical protein